MTKNQPQQRQPQKPQPQKFRVYKIRLNPEDARYGLDTKERRAEREEATGNAFSQQSLDAWKAACESTARSIYNSLPPAMQRAILEIRKGLPRQREDACCTRCGGKGYREDKQHWIEINGETVNGKVCFKCMGCGIEPNMEPVFFRRRTVDTLRNASPAKATEWANKVLATTDNPYRPVLLDIANAILCGEDPFALPH